MTTIGRIQSPVLSHIAQTLWVGQKVRLEIISSDRHGNGIILLAGRQVPAKIEAAVEVGEKFTAIVKEITPEGVVLAKITASKKGDNFSFLAGRGLPAGERLLKILLHYAKGQWSLKPVIDKYPALSSLIPRWESISSSTLHALLSNFFRALGLDYEARLFRLYKQRNHPQFRQEINALRTTIKGQLLSQAGDNPLYLNDSKIADEGFKASLLLNTLLAQQLWLFTGVHDHAYFIMNLPLYDGERVREARIAVESARKGTKVDVAHCHIGVEVDTENLGTVGADVWLFEDQIHIKILCDNLPSGMWDEHDMTAAREQFARIGLRLTSFQVCPYAGNKAFERFVRGEQGSGVDLQG